MEKPEPWVKSGLMTLDLVSIPALWWDRGLISNFQIARSVALLRGPIHRLGVTSNPIKIKLDNDPCHVLMLCDREAVGKGIQDARFRTVDMTGRRI
jgi:hypothetical protein